MRRSLVTLLFMVGCAPPPQAPTAHESRRDSDLVNLTPPAGEGTSLDAHLGTLLIHCDGDFMAAGTNGLVWAESNVVPFMDLAPQAAVLSCVGPSPHLPLAGGPGGLWRYDSMAWEQVGDAGVSLFVRHPSEQTVISVGQTTRLLSGVTNFNLGPRAVGAAWSRSGGAFVVLTSTGASVFDWSGSMFAPRNSFSAPVGEVFTSAVAIGELNPAAGLELAVVRADGGVLIFNTASGAPLARFDFGTSLAIEGDYSGGLDGLLVGDPTAGRVVLMIGDAGVQDWSFPDAGRYGATVASSLSTNARDLAVGAPDFAAGSGAVFTYRRFRIDPPGTANSCDVTAFCSSPTGTAGLCTAGTCVGGVLCTNETLGCPPGWECVLDHCTLDAGQPDAGQPDAGQPDAGQPDAGEPDAGVPDAGEPDAGEPDAGEPDAGTPDAGTSDAGTSPQSVPKEFVVFTCAAVPAQSSAAVLLLLLTLAARRPSRLSARSTRAKPSRRR